jgi:hypothetical protein
MSKKKKVTAPLSYDPGKGRPKEYLAYLNWQEMQALQRLNGGNMERGPMGLPSFPPDWRGNPNSTGNWSGAGGTSPGGTQGGGSDSGSRGSESSPSASDSADAANAAESQQQASDTAAQQEAANKNAAEAAKTSAFAEDARKAGIGSLNVGPMQTPVKIGGGAISQAVSSATAPTSVPSGFMTPQQQMADRMNTMYSPNALKGLYSGTNAFGISDPEKRSKIQESLLGQTIELSRMGKSVGYTAAPKIATSGYVDPLKSGVVTHWTGTPQGQRIAALGARKGYGYGVAIDPAGNIAYTKQFNKEGDYPQTFHAKGYNTGTVGVATVGLGEPNPSQVASARALGKEWFNPDASVTSHGYLAGDIAAQRRAAGEKFEGRLTREGKAIASAFSGGLSDITTPSFAGVSPISGPPTTNAVVSPASMRIQQVENQYNPATTPQVMTDTSKLTYDRLRSTPDGATTEVSPEEVESLDPANRAGFENAQQMQQYSPKRGTVKQPTPEEQKRLDMQNQWQGLDLGPQNYDTDQETLDRLASVYEGAGIGPKMVQRDDYVIGDEAQTYPKYVTPETQQIVEDQERINRRGVGVIKRGMPFFGGIVSGIERLQEVFTDKDIPDYATDQKYKYMQASPEEQAAMREKYPDIRRFAVSIGDIPPNTGTQYAGGYPRKELGGKSDPYSRTSSRTSYSPSGGPVSAASDTGRSQQYYLWDLGIGIPSPGEPEYNDYQRYLRERGASAEV